MLALPPVDDDSADGADGAILSDSGDEVAGPVNQRAPPWTISRRKREPPPDSRGSHFSPSTVVSRSRLELCLASSSCLSFSLSICRFRVDVGHCVFEGERALSVHRAFCWFEACCFWSENQRLSPVPAQVVGPRLRRGPKPQTLRMIGPLVVVAVVTSNTSALEQGFKRTAW